MEIVIIEYENYRGRMEKRYQIMKRYPSYGGYELDHIYSINCYPLERALEICKEHDWKVAKIGTFYELI